MTTKQLILALIPLPVIVPAATAAIALLLARFPGAQQAIALISLGSLLGIASTLVYLVYAHGIHTVQMGGWDGPIGITLVTDNLAVLMITVSQLVLFAVMWFGIGQGISGDDEDEPISIFVPTYMLLNMGISVAFLAGDLFSMYVGFEVLLVASYVLLTLGASSSRTHAGVSYVMVNMLSSMVFLLAVGLVYQAVGAVNFAHISLRMENIPDSTRTAIFAVLLVAFAVKAAMFPLSAWLPNSYPTAPSMVTAVFAGLLTKMGVYAIIRARSVVFPDGRLDDILMWAGLATMLMGILDAMAQNDIKRLLSFTLVSHIGCMIFGIAVGNTLGLGGAIFYVVHHILVQTALFLMVGLIERQAGSSSLRSLGGLTKSSPLLTLLYLVPALNLGGIPPFSGFLGEVMLIEADAQNGSATAWILVAGSIITSLLTLYTIILVWSKAFWRDRSDAPESDTVLAQPAALRKRTQMVAVAERDDIGRVPLGMVMSTALLVMASVGVTVLAGPLSNVATEAASNVANVDEYRAVVLGIDSAGDKGLEQLEDPGRTKSPWESTPVTERPTSTLEGTSESS